MMSSTDQLTNSSSHRHLVVYQGTETTMFALNAESVTAHQVILHAIDKPTGQQQTKKLESVHTARRCTCQCPPTVCTSEHIHKGVNVNTAVRSSVDHGCCRATFEHTRAKSLSVALRAQSPSPTSLTFGLISKPIHQKSLSYVGGAVRHLH